MAVPEREVLAWPVTMSFEREADAAVGHVLAAIAAAEPLVQPTFCSLFIDGADQGWFLHGDLPDEPEEAESGVPDDGEDDEIIGDDDEADGSDPEVGGQVRNVERIDKLAIGDLLRDALTPGGREPGWTLSLEGGADRPAPIHVQIVTRASRIWLDIQVWWTTWIESGSRRRADVEQLGRDLGELGWRRVELDGWSHVDPAAAAATADARVLDEEVSLTLRWAGTSAEEPLESASLVIAAIEALSPIFRPRRVTFFTRFAVEVDADTGKRPARSLWWLSEGEASSPTWITGGIGMRDSPTVDSDSMAAFAREALAPCRPGGLLGLMRRKRPVAWWAIEASEALVRVPDAPQLAARDTLSLRVGRRELSLAMVRRDDARWVTSPGLDSSEAEDEADDEIITGPISLWASPEGPTLELRLHWSLWAYRGAPGRAEVESALAALIRLGWSVNDARHQE